jgi:hypothetical protein
MIARWGKLAIKANLGHSFRVVKSTGCLSAARRWIAALKPLRPIKSIGM